MTRNRAGHLALTREQAAAATPRMLWSPRDVSRWGAVVCLSAVVLLGAWYSVSGKDNWDSQVLSLNVGLAAVIAANAAGVLLLLAGRRAVGVRRMALLGDPPPQLLVPYPTEPLHDLLTAPADALVAGRGLTHFHRADCPMAAHKSFAPATRSEHERAGLTACGVCRP